MREFLKGLDLDKELIDTIMAEHGKEITGLKEILIKQNNNPVNAYIGLDKDRLTAKIFCPYRLKNFKENYKQIPFFESNLNFVKRIAKKCDEYKAQLVEFCN